MRLKTRERAIRIILASLLESDLSTRELKELADSLSQHSLSWDLSDLLRDTLSHLTKFEEANKLPDRLNELEDLAYSIVQRRRLSKKVILNHMKNAASTPVDQMIQPKLSVRDMLHEFFLSAPLNEIDKFLELLQGSKKTDAYLKCIIQRD